MVKFHQALETIELMAKERKKVIEHSTNVFTKYYPKTKEYFESLEKKDLMSNYF